MNEKQYPIKYDPSYYVVTANDLIKGKQKMDLRESKILAIAISQVVKEDKDFKTYTTTVPELAAFMDIDENSLYRDLEGICRSLCQQIIEIQVGGENARGRKKWKIFHWISSAAYDDGKLTLRLSDDIKPYLLDLEAYYSQTLLGTLMTFRSYYATRLYQYLVADMGARWGNVEEWTFTCEQIRDIFQPYIKDDKGNIVKELYTRTYNLIQKTIKPALEELGASDFAYVWDYEEHRAAKRGRPLTGVSFKAIFFESKEKKDFYINKAKPFIEQYNSERSAADAANQNEDEPLDGLSTSSPVMQKAVAVLRKMSADEKELYEIEQREKAVRDEVSARAYERQQGITQGIENVIAKMKKSGMSDEQIQKILSIN